MLFCIFRCLNQNKSKFSSLSSTFSTRHASTVTSRQRRKDKIQESLPYDANGIILVPQHLHEHLFGETSASAEQIAQMARRKSEEDILIEDKLKLPQLKSKSLMGHFKSLAEEQIKL